VLKCLATSQNFIHTNVITFTSNPILQSNGASGTAQFTAEFTEPLMINLLIFDREWWRRPGIAQITDFIVNMTFDPVGLQRVWRQSTNRRRGHNWYRIFQ
jgi:hypothetical protein